MVDIVIFNTTHKPFDDPRVRRALSLANFDVALYPITVPADEVTAQHQSHLTNAKSPVSYSRHTDKKVDDLWEQQSRTLDPVTRKATVHQFEHHLLTRNYSLSVNG